MKGTQNILELKDQIGIIPTAPGCYFWIGKENDSGEEKILYVGKANNLRSRIRNYLTSNDYKTNFLMKKAEKVEWIITENEVEALLLESNLIKRHSPPYNIRLKDDKRYPYLCLTTGEPFPRLIITRKKTNPSHFYYGPYSDARAARNMVALIQRIFPIRKRALKLPLKTPSRPCLNFHIERCLAPCAGNVSRDEYGKMISEIKNFLDGNNRNIEVSLKKQMEQYANKKEYEKAASVRDTIRDIQTLYQTQNVHEDTQDLNFDIVALLLASPQEMEKELDIEKDSIQYSLYEKDFMLAQCVLLRIRNGNLINRGVYILSESALNASGGNELYEEYMDSFFRDYYLLLPDIPGQIYLNGELKSKLLWEQLLKQKKSVDIQIIDKNNSGWTEGYNQQKNLMEMAEKNVRLSLRERVLGEKIKNQRYGLRQLQKFLKLKDLPFLIECYDISNIQGKEAVGSGVTLRDGLKYTSGYRKYKIQTKDTPDDPAMMYEVLSRRFSRANEKKNSLPDLIVIDGGINQLNAALRARNELNLKVPVISLAKREEEIYCEDGTILRMDKNSPGMLILRLARDEAHRFGVSYHRLLRDKKSFM